MKRLGKVLHISKQDGIIIRGDEKKYSGSMRDMPRINSFVLDKSIKRIGRISGTFGPVDWPFFIVKPNKGSTDSDLKNLINDRVYVQ
ncbi:H/ACA ribonucleoprotein complex subunit GAR1 [Methanolobus halotolerans]|uniref:H/ACA RNA-protein complex protein Gar1 n=1 Tax=Methanolobus halotolerans TaxID=2052935 RepID=A0A4E0QDI4_9EURY|nr:Gar1/Naf1 family protein [Methanolobus halotolerans]TGC11441.1 H/ACA RNA-protein complex protein Gar1 [Methanolobus halotolerans]